MKFNAITKSITGTVSKVGFQLKKHSPELFIIGGLVAGAATVYTACKATLKVDSVVENTKEKIDKIHQAYEEGVTQAGEDYTYEDSKKDLTRVYVQTGVEFVKLYGPSVVLGVLSTTSILAGYNVLNKRYAASVAAYTAIDKSFKEYRGRVVERFGKELDRELKYNIKAAEVEETVVDGKGKEKTVKKTVDVVNPTEYSDYARFFDEGSSYWEKNAEYNLMFLKAQQNYANDLLRARKRVFLNDVYKMLDIPETKAGQVVGWIYDEENPVGDNFIDFGIYQTHRANRNFVNGIEPVILLDFNVDGNIWEKM